MKSNELTAFKAATVVLLIGIVILLFVAYPKTTLDKSDSLRISQDSQKQLFITYLVDINPILVSAILPIRNAQEALKEHRISGKDPTQVLSASDNEYAVVEYKLNSIVVPDVPGLAEAHQSLREAVVEERSALTYTQYFFNAVEADDLAGIRKYGEKAVALSESALSKLSKSINMYNNIKRRLGIESSVNTIDQ